MQIKMASKLSGVSTASMGKFDERLPGEKAGERQLGGKRRKFAPLVNSTELPAMTSMVDRLIRERADDIIDVDRAIGKVEVGLPEACRVVLLD
jgi:regulator of ribosome biosynthesis